MSLQGRGAAWGFVAPFIVGFAAWCAGPLAASLFLSLTDASGASARRAEYVGLANYRAALGVDRTARADAAGPGPWLAGDGRPTDPLVYRSLGNSLAYTAMTVPVTLAGSLALALLLMQRVRGFSIVRTIVYLPHLLGGVASLVIWSWLLNPRFGGINAAIRAVYAAADPLLRATLGVTTEGWPVPEWLFSPTWCKPALVLIRAGTVGGSVLILMAALQRVPPELGEAAALDGAGAWTRLRRVTLPQLRPALVFVGLIETVFAMQAFTESYVLSHRSQQDGLLFAATYLYRTAFESPHRLGYAAALGWILAGVTGVMIAPWLAWGRRRAAFEEGGT
ncbi:MAG: Lactose transport system permease protein LacF [Phycisphaerae bacterium]|nr:Lactose transport system permease protein LacF [Phycisphaerae bacterium]